MIAMLLPHAVIVPDDNPHCWPLPSALAVVEDPDFPTLRFFDEMAGAYGLADTLELWSEALPLWRLLYDDFGPTADSDIALLGDAA